jgi:hypothetical protein
MGYRPDFLKENGLFFGVKLAKLLKSFLLTETFQMKLS